MTRILIADDHPLYRQALMQAVRGVVADAVLDVNKGMFNWYIPGSLRNTSIRREGTALIVKGTLTYASTMDREWREGKAEIEFVLQECAIHATSR